MSYGSNQLPIRAFLGPPQTLRNAAFNDTLLLADKNDNQIHEWNESANPALKALSGALVFAL